MDIIHLSLTICVALLASSAPVTCQSTGNTSVLRIYPKDPILRVGSNVTVYCTLGNGTHEQLVATTWTNWIKGVESHEGAREEYVITDLTFQRDQYRFIRCSYNNLSDRTVIRVQGDVMKPLIKCISLNKNAYKCEWDKEPETTYTFKHRQLPNGKWMQRTPQENDTKAWSYVESTGNQEIRVDATNSVSSASSIITYDIRLNLKPNITYSGSTMTATSATLSWTTEDTYTGFFTESQVAYEEYDDETKATSDRIELNSGKHGNPATMTIDGLKPGRSYKFHIRSRYVREGNTFTEWTYVGKNERTKDSRPSETVQNLESIPRSQEDGIFLTWEAVPKDSRNGDILGYKIYVMNESYADVTPINVIETKYSLKGISYDVIYNICIAAYNSAGKSPNNCQTVSLNEPQITPSTGPSETVQNFELIPRSQEDGIFLTWNAVPKDSRNGDILGYKIYVMNESYADVTPINVIETKYSLKGISYDVIYNICIAAYNSAGKSPNNCQTVSLNEPQITPSTGPSETVQNFELIPRSQEDGIFLTWNAVPKDSRNGDILGYKIYVMNESYADVTPINVIETKYSLKGISYDVIYNICIAAYNSAGQSPNNCQTVSLNEQQITPSTDPDPSSNPSNDVLITVLIVTAVMISTTLLFCVCTKLKKMDIFIKWPDPKFTPISFNEPNFPVREREVFDDLCLDRKRVCTKGRTCSTDQGIYEATSEILTDDCHMIQNRSYLKILESEDSTEDHVFFPEDKDELDWPVVYHLVSGKKPDDRPVQNLISESDVDYNRIGAVMCILSDTSKTTSDTTVVPIENNGYCIMPQKQAPCSDDRGIASCPDHGLEAPCSDHRGIPPRSDSGYEGPYSDHGVTAPCSEYISTTTKSSVTRLTENNNDDYVPVRKIIGMEINRKGHELNTSDYVLQQARY